MKIHPLFLYLPFCFGWKPIYIPKTKTQYRYQQLLANPNYSIILAEGPAGTGKTAFAVQESLRSLKEPTIQKIILTRPIVCSDSGIGYLKGDLQQKMDPWVAPLLDVMREFHPSTKIKQWIREGVVEIAPFSYLRGRTFKNSFIIADEAQNATPAQIKLLLTRLGEHSKMVLTGDLKQSDLRTRVDGLRDLMNRLSINPICGFGVVRFESIDVQRHPLLPHILDLYENYDNK